MATPRISARLPPNIDPTKSSLAYGNRQLIKLNGELQSSQLITRQRALRSLCDVMHKPENMAESFRVGILESLKTLLMDDDPIVRLKATEVLDIMSTHAIGRDAFLKQSVIKPLSKLLNDEVFEVRSNAHTAIEMLTHDYSGGSGVLASGLVPVLVEKLKTEEDEIKELILDTLHNCMRIDAIPTLECKAMEVFTDLLTDLREGVRARAARSVMDLSFPIAGKEQACACDAVSYLVHLLSDQSMLVRAQAAGALMSISITTQGKYECIKVEAIPALVALLNDGSEDVRVNVVKAITTLAEAPEGRRALSSVVPKLKELYSDSNDVVIHAAKTAVEVIEWKP